MTNAKSNRLSRVLFWIVGGVALLWNAMGCINLFQQLSPGGLATLPPEYQAFIEVRPSWALIAFAISVIAGFIAAILLLLGSNTSIPAFILSAFGALVATLPALGSGITSVIIGNALSIILATVFAGYASRRFG